MDEYEKKVLKNTEDVLGKMGKAYSEMEGKAFLKIAANQPLGIIDKNYAKLGAFSKLAKYAGPAAIGLGIGLTIAGVKSNEEVMIDMIKGVSDQITKFHNEVMTTLKHKDEQDRLRAALGRIAVSIATIENYQAEINTYWQKYASISVSERHEELKFLSMRINASDLGTAVQAIHNEVTGVIDGSILKAKYKASDGDMWEVTELGVMLLDLVAAAPAIHATWKSGTYLDLNQELQYMNAWNMQEDFLKDDVEGYSKKIDEVEAEVKKWIGECTTWDNLVANYQDKMAALAKDIQNDPEVPWASIGTGMEVETIGRLHTYVASRMLKALARAYPFTWVVTVSASGGEDDTQTTYWNQCGFNRHERNVLAIQLKHTDMVTRPCIVATAIELQSPRKTLNGWDQASIKAVKAFVQMLNEPARYLLGAGRRRSKEWDAGSPCYTELRLTEHNARWATNSRAILSYQNPVVDDVSSDGMLLANPDLLQNEQDWEQWATNWPDQLYIPYSKTDAVSAVWWLRPWEQATYDRSPV